MPRPTRADAQRNRRKVLQAALALEDRPGPDPSMQDIAGTAGVAMTTVYRSFPTRLALYSEAYATRMCDELAGAVAALPGPDPVRGLYDLALAQVATAMRHIERLSQMPGWIDVFIDEFLRRYEPIVERAMIAAQQAGGLESELMPEDIGGVTRLFLGGLAQAGQPSAQAQRYIRIWFRAVAPGWTP